MSDATQKPGTTSDHVIDRSDARLVAIGSAVAAVSSTLVVLAAPRLSQTVADGTIFLTFWSTLFAALGVLTGISVETTRAVSAVSHDTARARATGPRVGVAGTATGLAFAALLAAAAPWWGPAVFGEHAVLLALLVALGCAGCAVHASVTGALAGAGRWQVYARLVGGESSVRLVLVVAAGLAGASVVGWGAGAAVAAFTAVGFLIASRQARSAVQVRADVPVRPYVGRLLAAAVASGSSAVLVIGFPTLLAATTDAAAFTHAAPLLLALTLTRAPLMIPLNAFQGVAVTHFVQHRERGLRALLPIARVVVPVGALGALAAWLVGPALMELIGDGPAYRVAGPVLALLTLAATGLAMLTLTGAVCQALTRHGAFVSGWLTALAVAIGLLLLPGSLETRASVALLAGPVAGIVVHLVALRPTGSRTGRTP